MFQCLQNRDIHCLYNPGYTMDGTAGTVMLWRWVIYGRQSERSQDSGVFFL